MESIVNLEKRPLSYSSLKEFAKSPAHYIHYLTAPKEKSDAFTMGSLVDCMLLTPARVEEIFVISPKVDRRTKQGKADWELFVQANSTKQWVSQETWEQAANITRVIKTNPSAIRIMERFNDFQASIKWTEKVEYLDQIVEIPMVAKLDLVGIEDIGDLKTTKSAKPDKFGRSVFDYGYELQAAIYLKAMATRKVYPNFFFISVEKVPPYGISVHKATNEVLQYGKDQLDKLLMEFAHCMVNNLWHESYDFRAPNGYFQLYLPGWLKNK